MRNLKLALLVLTCGLTAAAQQLTKIGEFSGLDNEVQLVPGPFVIVNNDVAGGGSNIYAYRDGRFLKTTRNLRNELAYWKSFNWAAVDFRNQIDRNDFEDQSLSAFVPNGSQVKSFGRIDGAQSAETLFFICYASPPKDPSEAITGEQRDLHIAMLKRRAESAKGSYEELTDLLVARAAFFGSFVIQKQPAGIFVTLYSSGSSSGSHVTNTVDVFLISPESNKP